MQLLTIRAAGFTATVDACAQDGGQMCFLSLLENQQSVCALWARGYFVGFGFSADATKEIRRVAREEGLDIRPITVKQLLEYERVVG